MTPGEIEKLRGDLAIADKGLRACSTMVASALFMLADMMEKAAEAEAAAPKARRRRGRNKPTPEKSARRLAAHLFDAYPKTPR